MGMNITFKTFKNGEKDMEKSKRLFISDA